MHELAITCSIVELVEQAAMGRRVLTVTVEIGKLSGVLPDAIEFCFPEVARGTQADGASLDIREIEAWARCDACGHEFSPSGVLATCPCGSIDVRRIRGDELTIRSIEIDEEEVA